MMAVFVAFAGASIATVSQLGIGLTIAVCSTPRWSASSSCRR
jgi:hypothetical protein